MEDRELAKLPVIHRLSPTEQKLFTALASSFKFAMKQNTGKLVKPKIMQQNYFALNEVFELFTLSNSVTKRTEPIQSFKQYS